MSVLMQEKMAVEPVEPVSRGSSSALVNTPAHSETLVQYEPQEVTKQEVATDKTVSYGEEATAKATEEQKDSFELPPRLVLDSTPSSPTTSASVSNTSSATCCSSQEEEVPECADSKMHTDCKSALKRAKAQPWTEEEHLRFLTGLQKLGKGNWSSVSKYYVPTRTPAQVASHAQKHFMRLSTYYQCQGGIRKRKSRFSVLDSACAAAGSTNQRVLKPANGQVYQPACGWSAASQPKNLLPTTAGWPEQSHFAHQVHPSGTTHYTAYPACYRPTSATKVASSATTPRGRCPNYVSGPSIRDEPDSADAFSRTCTDGGLFRASSETEAVDAQFAAIIALCFPSALSLGEPTTQVKEHLNQSATKLVTLTSTVYHRGRKCLESLEGLSIVPSVLGFCEDCAGSFLFRLYTSLPKGRSPLVK
eukprot:CAMPEP_0198213956 /NCGR_PEP_ID=MMETSP1445-20131203/35698_1 /TAXON_ID=36898 /ORGANISM="Pyramimonas sp., Strain CCMP2087" /LENGTH=418 /DNA_ID=CAMNT_0043888857 /DNA_START=41 /DNA_END=1296 /DNA_ORIENTATION=-